MAPLVPEFINDELNLIVALLMGIAFGFVLEQAGFSSSRKLTGLFYGTDFTVLRVFFTAGVTAMSGVIIFSRLGWLDPDMIFVNPTFLHSAIAGGVIMGLGFVIGGYCPGTSVCAAAVGRIDAMAFVGGSLLGIFAFGEAFPKLEEFYKAGAQGDLLVSSLLGLTNGQFAFLLIAVAVGAFVMVGRIEKKVNPESPLPSFPLRYQQIAAGFVLVLGLFFALTPERKAGILAKAHDAQWLAAHPVAVIDDDELALRILDRDGKLEIIDVRGQTAFARQSLPGAIGIPLENLFSKEYRDLLSSPSKKIFLGSDADQSVAAAAVARLLGASNVAAVEGGMAGFETKILKAGVPSISGDADSDLAARFRAEAAPRLVAMMKERGAAKPVKAPKRVQGGCGS